MTIYVLCDINKISKNVFLNIIILGGNMKKFILFVASLLLVCILINSLAYSHNYIAREEVVKLILSQTSLLLEISDEVEIEVKCLDSKNNEVLTDEIKWRVLYPDFVVKLSNVVGNKVKINAISHGQNRILVSCDNVRVELLVSCVKSKIAISIAKLEVNPSEVYLPAGESVEISTIAYDSKGDQVFGYELETLVMSTAFTVSANKNKLVIKAGRLDDNYAKITSEIMVNVRYGTAKTNIKITIIEKACFSTDKSILSGFISSSKGQETKFQLGISYCTNKKFNIEYSNDISNIKLSKIYSTIIATIHGNTVKQNDSIFDIIRLKSTEKDLLNTEIKIPMYLYTYPKIPEQPRLNYGGFKGIGANESKTNSLSIIDAPSSLNPLRIWDKDLNSNYYSNEQPIIIWKNRIIRMYKEYEKNDAGVVNKEKYGLVCFGLSDGLEIWKSDCIFVENSHNTDWNASIGFVSASGDYLITAANNKLSAINIFSGETKWEWNKKSEIISSWPVAINNFIYTGGNHIRCHDIKSGKVLWSTGISTNFYNDLVAYNNQLYVGCKTPNNKYFMFLLDCLNGNTIFSKQIFEPDLCTVISGNYLLQRYTKNQNTLVCRDVKTGNENWSFKCKESAKYYFDPIINDLHTLLLNGDLIRCFDTRNGKIIWSKRTPDTVTSIPIITGNRLFVLTQKKGIYTYDLKSGNLLSSQQSIHLYDFEEWVDFAVGEGTIVAIYKTNTSFLLPTYRILCYSDSTRFKNKKIVGLEMKIDSNLLTINNVSNNEYISIPVSPKIINDLLYIPVNCTVDKFGGSIRIIDNKYIIKLGSNTLEVIPGKSDAVLNGKSILIDPKNKDIHPIVLSNNLLLPNLFFSKTFQINTFWFNDLKTVVLTYSWLF